jgi:pyruvate/2-oxoglutarate dehydrogenase complex dihydrolipoamide dehydrogenase (E3) component
MSTLWDAVVVGAGPYGLSAAAHLLGRGLRVAVFGKPLELWREHMPKGMLLRSHWWATNLSDPRGAYSFERFFQQSSVYRKGYPLPIQGFIDYGMWFQRHAVPSVDETYVASIARRGRQFEVTLEDGRTLETRAVVMATGLSRYAHRPAEYRGLPAGLVSHSSEHSDFGRFQGRRVVVIGGGQSAVEFAALLQEAGALVDLVSRRPLLWLAPDRVNERSLVERLIAPRASVAPGWTNWVLDHLPYLFYRLSQSAKDGYNSNYRSGATDWLKQRVVGKVRLHEGTTVMKLEPADRGVAASLSDGLQLAADHVMLATGYKADVANLTMIDGSLRAQIGTDAGTPVLSHWFEATVPGLYFVGFASLRTFGPLYRFVAGCGAAARRVASSVARARGGRSGRAVPVARDVGQGTDVAA